jgi:hypothetical protein
MKLSPDQREALARHLLKRFRLFVAEKTGLPMTLVARAFDVAELFGAGVPTGDAFVGRYWTTVGPVIFTPLGYSTALGERLRVLSHEATHGVQFWRDHVAFLARYLTSRGRAELEAEAERGACEVWWMLTGTIPADLGAIDICRHGYALKTEPGEHDDNADLTRDLLEQAVTSIRAGVVSTDVGLAALAWLRAEAPEAIVGRVL